MKINEQFSGLVGGTIDFVEHEEGIPSAVKRFDGSDYDYGKTDLSGQLYNVNASLLYKPTEASSLYVTFNKGQHFNANTGGAINGDTLDGDLETELFEIGANVSLFDDKAYLGVAIFDQEYTTQNQDSSTDVVETTGIEIEFNYQPNRNFFATVGYSFWIPSVPLGSLATSHQASDVASGGFFTSPTFPGIEEGAKFETPGVPEHLLNALVQYKFDNGFGVQGNIVFTSEMEAGYDGGQIPGGDAAGKTEISSASLGAQYEIDAKIFYEYKKWRFEFAIFNLTDEENWDLPNTGYAIGSQLPAQSATTRSVPVTPGKAYES